MMRVELTWVDALLSRWGRWAIRRESGALGFASSCFLAQSGSGDGYDSGVPKGVVDDDMQAVDAAVTRLPKVLRLSVLEVYQLGQGKSDRVLAASLGLHVDTLRKYICDAHRKIALDIERPCAQNLPHSANGGSCPSKKQPAQAYV